MADLLPAMRGRLIVEVTEQTYRDVAGLWSTLESLAKTCELVLLDDLTIDDLARPSRAHAPVDGTGRPTARASVTTWPADAPLRPPTVGVRAPAARYRRG